MAFWIIESARQSAWLTPWATSFFDCLRTERLTIPLGLPDGFPLCPGLNGLELARLCCSGDRRCSLLSDAPTTWPQRCSHLAWTWADWARLKTRLWTRHNPEPRTAARVSTQSLWSVTPSSEDQLQRQLDLPWAVGLPINHSVAAEVIHPCSRRAELHAVEGVKELGAKLGDEFTLLEGVVLEER